MAYVHTCSVWGRILCVCVCVLVCVCLCVCGWVQCGYAEEVEYELQIQQLLKFSSVFYIYIADALLDQPSI